MFCIHCGTQLPDGASFCSKCGKPQQQGVQANIPEQIQPVWETCEIFYKKKYERFTGTDGYLYVEAIGPYGVRQIASTEVFGCGYNSWTPDASNQKTVQFHKSLITQIVKDGWEPTGVRGENWWSTQFRRQFSSVRQEFEECEIGFQFTRPNALSRNFKFVAWLPGSGPNPSDIRIVAESQQMKDHSDLRSEESKTKPEVINVYRSFIEQLTRDGWEPKNTVGNRWYKKQFRHQINK